MANKEGEHKHNMDRMQKDIDYIKYKVGLAQSRYVKKHDRIKDILNEKTKVDTKFESQVNNEFKTVNNNEVKKKYEFSVDASKENRFDLKNFAKNYKDINDPDNVKGDITKGLIGNTECGSKFETNNKKASYNTTTKNYTSLQDKSDKLEEKYKKANGYKMKWFPKNIFETKGKPYLLINKSEDLLYITSTDSKDFNIKENTMYDGNTGASSSNVRSMIYDNNEVVMNSKRRLRDNEGLEKTVKPRKRIATSKEGTLKSALENKRSMHNDKINSNSRGRTREVGVKPQYYRNKQLESEIKEGFEEYNTERSKQPEKYQTEEAVHHINDPDLHLDKGVKPDLSKEHLYSKASSKRSSKNPMKRNRLKAKINSDLELKYSKSVRQHKEPNKGTVHTLHSNSKPPIQRFNRPLYNHTLTERRAHSNEPKQLSAKHTRRLHEANSANTKLKKELSWKAYERTQFDNHYWNCFGKDLVFSPYKSIN